MAVGLILVLFGTVSLQVKVSDAQIPFPWLPCVNDSDCTVDAAMVCFRKSCTCNESTFYANGVCTESISVEQVCDSYNHDDRQCVENAFCDKKKCQCRPGFFLNGTTCQHQLSPNSLCSPKDNSSLCVKNAECKKSGAEFLCLCQDGYYVNGTHCNQSISVKQACNSYNHDDRQCVENAICDKKKCQCRPGFFLNGTTCQHQLSPNSKCSPKDNSSLCVENAECKRSGAEFVCLCQDGYYVKGANCSQTLNANEPCDKRNPDLRQCTPSSVCNVRDKKCKCKDGYYVNNTHCSKKIQAGGACSNLTNDVCETPSFCAWIPSSGRTECTCTSGYSVISGTCRRIPTTWYTSSKAPATFPKQASPFRQESTADSDSPEYIGTIIAGCLAAIFLITVVVLVVILLRRRQSRSRSHDSDGSERSQMTDISRISRREDYTSVPITYFPAYLHKLRTSSDRLLSQQFQKLQQLSGDGYSTHVGSLKRNSAKNRYSTVLPYDHSLVTIHGQFQSGQPTGAKGYINANYIEGLSSTDEYIATQAPLANTIADFWNMIFEQRSGVIIMLASQDEIKKGSVDEYWPKESIRPHRYGDLSVELTSTRTQSGLTIRSFMLSMVLHQPLQVTHIHVARWAEGEAIGPEKLLKCVRDMRQVIQTRQKPTTVHCSSGTGRSGVFIAVDVLCHYVDEHSVSSEIDVCGLCYAVMTCRPNIIQSLAQYALIHETVRLVIERKLSDLQDLSNAPRPRTAYHNHHTSAALEAPLSSSGPAEVYALPMKRT